MFCIVRNRCINIPETGGTRQSATAQFFPQNENLPRISNLDTLTIAADDLLQALQSPRKTDPSLKLDEGHYTALKQLAQIFNNASKKAPMILQPPQQPLLQQHTENSQQVEKETPTGVQKLTKPTSTPKESNLIPFTDEEVPQAFNRFAQRPATHQYNTRNKYQPHIIPTCNAIVKT